MGLKLVTCALGCALTINAIAANNTDIDSLQQQINQLQSQINNMNAAVASTNIIGTDFNSPLLATLFVNRSYTFLSQIDQYNHFLTIGGKFEADMQAWGGNTLTTTTGSTYNNGTDLAATTADIATLANINQWTQAFIHIAGGLNGASTNIAEAFLTFGNLNKSPLYFTAGREYIPFGAFAAGNAPYANDLVTNLYRGQQNIVALGAAKDGLNANLGVINGQSNLSNFLANLQYQIKLNAFNVNLGAGYLNDVRYGAQAGMASAYALNGTTPSAASPLTGGRNEAVDLNTAFTWNLPNQQAFTVTGEWISTLGSAFYNNIDTGKMGAWDAAVVYTTPPAFLSTVFGLSYSATYNMQQVPLPLAGDIANSPSVAGVKNQWLGFVNAQIWKNVYLGPEYANMQLYNGQRTWETTIDLAVYF